MYPVFWTLSIVMLIFSFNGLICISPRRYYNTYFTVKLYTMSLHTCIPCYYIVQTRCPCRRMLRFRTIFRRIRNIVPQRAPDRRPYIHDGKCYEFAGKQWEFVMFYRAGGGRPPLREVGRLGGFAGEWGKFGRLCCDNPSVKTGSEEPVLPVACGQPGRGSGCPPDSHSLPRLRFAYPLHKGGFGAECIGTINCGKSRTQITAPYLNTSIWF